MAAFIGIHLKLHLYLSDATIYTALCLFACLFLFLYMQSLKMKLLKKVIKKNRLLPLSLESSV